jgi:hypothetical protein
VLQLNETLAKKARISGKDITNRIKRKGAIVSLVEQPIPRFPKLASFRERHSIDISLVAMDCVGEYGHHQTLQGLHCRTAAACAIELNRQQSVRFVQKRLEPASASASPAPASFLCVMLYIFFFDTFGGDWHGHTGLDDRGSVHSPTGARACCANASI